MIAELFHSGILYLGASAFFGVICVYGLKLLIDIRTQLRNLNIRVEDGLDDLEYLSKQIKELK